MAFLRFGKKIKNRSFDYSPRYYDQEKEELEKRLSRYKKSSSGDTDLTKERIRGSFRKTYRVKDDYTSRSQKRSNYILLGTLLVLIFFTYVFLMEYLPKILEAFE